MLTETRRVICLTTLPTSTLVVQEHEVKRMGNMSVGGQISSRIDGLTVEVTEIPDIAQTVEMAGTI